MSWIHIDDIVGIFLLALDHPEARGPINGTAPNPVRNAEFAKALARVLWRPYVPFGPPDAVLELMLGEVAQVVTQGPEGPAGQGAGSWATRSSIPTSPAPPRPLRPAAGAPQARAHPGGLGAPSSLEMLMSSEDRFRLPPRAPGAGPSWCSGPPATSARA